MSSSSVLQDYQLEVARQLAYVWVNSDVKAEVFDDDDVNIHLVRISEIDRSGNTFVERAYEAFEKNEGSLQPVLQRD